MPQTQLVSALMNTPTGIPIGSVAPFSGGSVPSGFSFCDGSALSRTTFASLFAVIGTTYGVGDGSTTFNIPDMRGKVAFGKAGSGTFVTLGSSGGAETHSTSDTGHTHSASGSAHTHGWTAHTHTVSAAGGHQHVTTGIGTLIMNSGGTLSLGFEPSNYTNPPEANHGSNHAHGDNTQSASPATTASGTVPDLPSQAVGFNSATNLQPYLVTNHIIRVS